MRNSTRQRYYGRSTIASSLRMASQDLEAALKEFKKPPPETPSTQLLKKVVKELQECIRLYDHYKMPGKRLKQKIEREVKNLHKLTAEMQQVPVFQDEKDLAKAERTRKKRVCVR